MCSEQVRHYNVLCGLGHAPGLVARLVKFYGLVGRWLAQLSAVEAASVPEHVVSDMAFVLEHYNNYSPHQLASQDASGVGALGYAIEVMATLLTKGPALVKNPLVRESIAALLRRLLQGDGRGRAPPAVGELHDATSRALLLGGDRGGATPCVGLMSLYIPSPQHPNRRISR